MAGEKFIVSSKTENFGKYKLVDKLAAGGMAEVFLARSSTNVDGIAKFFAIKRILPQYSDNPEFIEMFKEEAKICVNLNHSNVVSIYDFGVENSQFYLSMEYVEGLNLRQILNQMRKDSKTFSIDQIVFIIKEIAAGLDHAHRCIDGATGKPLGITHRDMSPQNVMISFEGEIKIVDFGIAKAETQLETTKAGTIKGKFGYMSPEQADGQIVDLRTDIFSLGIILWELLANDRLFTSNSEAGTLKKIRDCLIPSIKKMNPLVPTELERICQKALTKDKTLRYQRAVDLHRDLNRFLNTQYPDFSSQDFSQFMKSAFSNNYIENRKKLIGMSKEVQMDDEKTVADHRDSEKTYITNTETSTPVSINHQFKKSTASEISSQSLDKDGEINVEVSNSKIDLASMKKKTGSVLKKQPVNMVPNGYNWRTRKNHSNNTISAYDYQSALKSKESSGWGLFIATLILIGTSFYTYKTPEEKLPIVLLKAKRLFIDETPAIDISHREPMGNLTSNESSVNTQHSYSVNLQTSPLGAKVIINGTDINKITPTIVNLDPTKSHTITFRKAGYPDLTKTYRLETNPYSINESLEIQKTASLFILTAIPSERLIVSVNGQTIAYRTGEKINIEANKEVLLDVYDSKNNLRDQHKLFLSEGQNKEISIFKNQKY